MTSPEQPEKYVRTPEDEAMMARAAEEAELERQENAKKFEKQTELLSKREGLKEQIENINQELRDMLGYDFRE